MFLVGLALGVLQDGDENGIFCAEDAQACVFVLHAHSIQDLSSYHLQGWKSVYQSSFSTGRALFIGCFSSGLHVLFTQRAQVTKVSLTGWKKSLYGDEGLLQNVSFSLRCQEESNTNRVLGSRCVFGVSRCMFFQGTSLSFFLFLIINIRKDISAAVAVEEFWTQGPCEHLA